MSKKKQDYENVELKNVLVRGISCEFYPGRLNRESLPEGKYLYEVESGGLFSKNLQNKVTNNRNFIGSIVTDEKFLEEDTNVMWPNILFLADTDWDWQIPPATKDEELDALREIRAILDRLGKDSYVGTAMEGCLEIAEKNVNYP